MTEYYFYDTDLTGQKDFDICGADYRQLLTVCCNYCTTFSVLSFHPDTRLLHELKKYKIDNANVCIPPNYLHYGCSSYEDTRIKYYRICPELLNLLLISTNSIFEWIYGWGYQNPTDPTFYREDGSVFFSSLVHNGECTIFAREGEDISSILASGLWTNKRR